MQVLICKITSAVVSGKKWSCKSCI